MTKPGSGPNRNQPQPTKMDSTGRDQRWIPCHGPPLSSIPRSRGIRGKVWTVSQINLATGEHVITRPPGLSKANLRMIDLEPFIDEDEEL